VKGFSRLAVSEKTGKYFSNKKIMNSAKITLAETKISLVQPRIAPMEAKMMIRIQNRTDKLIMPVSLH
jgi:hypothetical protein